MWKGTGNLGHDCLSYSQNDEDDEINSGNVSIVRKCLPLICEWIRQMEKKETEENEDNERRILSFFFMKQSRVSHRQESIICFYFCEVLSSWN